MSRARGPNLTEGGEMVGETVRVRKIRKSWAPAKH